MGKARSYSDKDIKLLWARSGGICYFPGCRNEMTLPDTNLTEGEMAHIVAHSDNGPRGDPKYPRDKLDSYENLILLCPTRHTRVDPRGGDPEELGWTIEVLRKMKHEHEQWVRRTLNQGEPWDIELSSLYYINIPRLSILAAHAGYDVETKSLKEISNLHSLEYDLIYTMEAFKELLKKIHPQAVPIEKITELRHEIIGATCSFNGRFRTKNIPRLDHFSQGKFALEGDEDIDPHIYQKHQNFKLHIAIDPRWITTTTSFVSFRPSSGQNYFAGLCTIKNIDEDRQVLFATPLVIGVPMSDFHRLLFGN